MSPKSNLYDSIRKETFYSREEIKALVSDDYIRGLIEGEGSFANQRKSDGTQMPAFVIKMHIRDKELLEGIRDYLGLSEKVHEYLIAGRHFAMFQVRDIGTLKNKVIPLFRGKLLGHKGTQLEAWIGNYPYLNSLNLRHFTSNIPQGKRPL